jgi:hypothetical protein
MKERYPETRESKKKRKKGRKVQSTIGKTQERNARFSCSIHSSMVPFSNNILLLLPVFSIHSFLSFIFSISQFYFYNPPGSPAVSTTRFSDLQNIILRILIITARLYNYCIVIQTRSKKKSVPVFECATITHPRLWKPSNLKWNRVCILKNRYIHRNYKGVKKNLFVKSGS